MSQSVIMILSWVLGLTIVLIFSWRFFNLEKYYLTSKDGDLDGHLKIPHLWPGQNPPATGQFQFTNLL